jgi:hypothetical protein
MLLLKTLKKHKTGVPRWLDEQRNDNASQKMPEKKTQVIIACASMREA